jgi:glucose/arabinose dehydrogenase
MTASGDVPADNPFVGRDGADPYVYTYGHRNPQGLVYDAPSGRIYLHEHGPKGGDELNLLVAGRNYGWPAITYGKDYSGALISPFTEAPGMEQPLVYWTPSIAPSGMTVYRGDQFPEWRGQLFVGALVEKALRQIEIRQGKVARQAIVFGEIGERIRDVRTGPDGALYILTGESAGRLLGVRRGPQ